MFVRELLQNARDAGARRVVVTTAATGDEWRVSCRDDGEGMTEAHARAYLFRLYTSSKEGASGAVGRFGVGFWSVLRFAPRRIVVRSWPRRGQAWEADLSGDLDRVTLRPLAGTGRGTEVVLVREAGEGDLAAAVRAAASADARFLTLRGSPERPLPVLVDGVAVSADFALPAPSLAFRGHHGARGVVALGSEPRVELLSGGLRVREAASLDELLGPVETPPAPAAAAGLAPQAILDGPLSIVLARSDARADLALRRLVARARRQLARLVREQLESARPSSRRERWRRLRRPLAHATAAVAMAALATAALRPGAPPVPAPASPPAASVGGGPGGIPVVAATPSAPRRAYRDPGPAYHGPTVDGPGPSAPAPLALTYTPVPGLTYFTTLVVDDVDAAAASPLDVVQPAASFRCDASCIDVRLEAAGPARLRLPVPVGHRVDTTRVTVDGRPAPVLRTPRGEAVVETGSRVADIAYRTGPAPRPRALAGSRGARPAVLREAAAAWRGQDVPSRVGAALRWVEEHVGYGATPELAARHAALRAARAPLADRALAIGAGDCDVQNGVLALLLQEAGLPARLVIGYVGANGEALPGLHAWTEYGDPDAGWSVADASRDAALEPGSLPPPSVATVAIPPAVPTPGAPSSGWPGNPAAAWLLGAGAAGVVGLVVRRRPRAAATRLRDDGALLEILEGALRDPAAYAHARSVFEREIVPRVGGGALALGQAWALAQRGRLYVSRRGGALARRAAAAGVPVIDGARAEGALVSGSLGAVDLDAWEGVLERSRVTPLLAAANGALEAAGERWRVRTAHGVGPLALLELEVSGHPFYAVLDPAAAWYAALERAAGPDRGGAVLRLLDGLAERLRLGDERRIDLLARVAPTALEGRP